MSNHLQEKIPMQELCIKQVQHRLFGVKPVVLTDGQNVIKKHKIQNNLMKELQISEASSLIVINLLSQNDKQNFSHEKENINIAYEVSVKQLFDSSITKQAKIDQYLLNANLYSILKRNRPQQAKESDEKVNVNKEEIFNPWSIRLFPFHKSIHFFSMHLPQIIVPLSQNDMLSYQKVQRISNYQYIYALAGYEQKGSQKLETQIYLNWGESVIEFVLINESGQEYRMLLETCEIIIIPAMYTYRWKVTNNSNSIGKLITWKILPKKTLSTIFKYLQQQEKKVSCSYSIFQVLIDYCFHQFGLIEAQNEEFMYNLANLLNRWFVNELIVLQKGLNLPQNQVIHGSIDKKVDQCQICGKFIVNYFGYFQNFIYCLECVIKEKRVQKIYQKMTKLTFEKGCEILTRIKSFKDQKEVQNENVSKLMQNAVFFDYEDICDGDFIGSYNNVHCKINQTNPKKSSYSKQKIVQNTIKQLKKDLSISRIQQIFQKYSKVPYSNQLQRKFYREILVRTSKFIRKQQEHKILSQMLPSYRQNDLQIFAIQLFTKDIVQ